MYVDCLYETTDGLLLYKGQKIVLSAGIMQTIVKWYHEQLNHLNLSTLSKAVKSNFYTWGLEQNGLKKIYSDLRYMFFKYLAP